MSSPLSTKLQIKHAVTQAEIQQLKRKVQLDTVSCDSLSSLDWKQKKSVSVFVVM